MFFDIRRHQYKYRYMYRGLSRKYRYQYQHRTPQVLVPKLDTGTDTVTGY